MILYDSLIKYTDILNLNIEKRSYNVMSSIKDIAKALNMSVSTISLALNNKPRVSKETRELVLAKAKELNYVKNGLAADLKRKKTDLILFIVNDASRSYFSSIIDQLQKSTSAFGYDFLICTTYNNHTSTAERFIKEHRADAVIIYTSTISDSIIQENANENFPIIILGRKVIGENIYCYGYQDYSETLETTDYLLQTGHRKIAFVKGSSVSLGTSRTFKKYQESLKRYHLEYDENIVFDATDSSYQHGYEITKKILPIIPSIDAIQYSTDDIAIGGMMYLQEKGIKIPEDISIVGRNNIPESAFTSPPLTTSGKTNDDHLFYESIVHFLIASVEKNEENTIVREQLKKHLDKCNHQFELIIRNSVKLRK